MMNILVTGANGQLGNEMRRVSLDSRNRYLFTDVNELDITDATAVRNMLKKEQIDVIVNCAAYTNVDKAEDDYDMADLLNNKAVENLAIAAKEVNATLIHISTDYVFQDLNFHRVMAHYMPHNQRSGNVLKRLGFVVEGYARDYLLINGKWQDHILTSLINPNWQQNENG